MLFSQQIQFLEVLYLCKIIDNVYKYMYNGYIKEGFVWLKLILILEWKKI